MSVPLKGMLSGGIWWSWHFLLQKLAYERQLGKEADDIFAMLMGAAVTERPGGYHPEDYCVALNIGRHYHEPRNWSPPNAMVVIVRLEYVEDLKRHEWKAKTVMFTRWVQCRKGRGDAQTAEEHFRGNGRTVPTRVFRRAYGGEGC